ncbi:MAG: PLP-dependent transferase [Clostridia bacterium]|nr:PLP-dependent transferase [Clostridia bacterium]
MSRKFETRCIHGEEAHAYEDPIRAVSFPIYQTATFAHSVIGHEQFNYTRQDNPTRLRAEEILASLEGAAQAVAFASGMAAVAALVELLSPGDHILCSDDLYGGVTRLFNNICRKNGLLVSFVDTTDAEAIARALRPETKLLYIETPSNPTMRVTDIRVCAALAHENGALLAVDNTFLTPVYQRPIELGADIVVHSGTKYLAGHNDTIAGFLALADPSLAEKIRLIGKSVGSMLSPFDSWLVQRGMKTLAIRMERAQENALKVAAALRSTPRVCEVYYIGLEDHPGYAVNARQASGSGAMISFRVDSEETARRVLQKVRLITFAESLGGAESLITYPITQTHSDVPPEQRARLGIDGRLLRLSVGLEDADDLIEDLCQALEV